MAKKDTGSKGLARGGIIAGLAALAFWLFRKPAGGGGKEDKLVVTTLSALDVLSGSATLNGSLDSFGENESAVVSFEWGTTTNYGEKSEGLEYIQLSSFSVTLDGLLPNTLYHFRAKAVGIEVAYGADRQFATLASGVEEYNSITANFS